MVILLEAVTFDRSTFVDVERLAITSANDDLPLSVTVVAAAAGLVVAVVVVLAANADTGSTLNAMAAVTSASLFMISPLRLEWRGTTWRGRTMAAVRRDRLLRCKVADRSQYT